MSKTFRAEPRTVRSGSTIRAKLLPSIVTVLLVACDASLDDRVLSIEATGGLNGSVFFDRNGNRGMDEDDTPLVAAQVLLTVPGADAPLFQGQTVTTGSFTLPQVPVGRYALRFVHPVIGDSVSIVFVHPEVVDIAAGDLHEVIAIVSYPTASVEQIRSRAETRKVFVEGVALNDWSALGDSTIHLSSNTGVIRATRVRPSDALEGDSLRLLGTPAMVNGQPVLDDVRIFRIGSVDGRPATITTTGVAATANEGGLDAGLVAVARAALTDTSSVGPHRLLTINDGTGPLEVVVNRGAEDDPRYEPGALVDVTGLLVPLPGGEKWRLRVRRDTEFRLSF